MPKIVLKCVVSHNNVIEVHQTISPAVTSKKDAKFSMERCRSITEPEEHSPKLACELKAVFV